MSLEENDKKQKQKEQDEKAKKTGDKEWKISMIRRVTKIRLCESVQ